MAEEEAGDFYFEELTNKEMENNGLRAKAKKYKDLYYVELQITARKDEIIKELQFRRLTVNPKFKEQLQN